MRWWRILMLATTLAACASGKPTTPSAHEADASGDALPLPVDATVVVRVPNYTKAFRKGLANPAPADLQEGERVFFEETYGAELHHELPPAAFLVALWQSDPQKYGTQFANYGFLPDPGDDLPIGLKRGSQDPSLVHHTCSTCHVTKLPDGRLWSGMPATNLDWGRFQLDVHDAWEKAGHPALLDAPARQRFAALQRGSLDVASTGAHGEVAIVNDFPMYAELHRMKHLNILGSGLDLRTEVWLSLFGFTDPLPFPDAARTGPLDAYFGWMPTPQPLTPPPSDVVQRGAQVFASGQCATCHHVDDPGLNDTADWLDGPERLPGQDKAHPHGTIATDGLFFQSASGALEGDGSAGPGPGLLKLVGFIADNDLSVTPPTGYVASNLHALFATAPYLHNGAVPTLEALLQSPPERPKTFTRAGFLVDTSKPGLGNQGHAFGTALSAADKSDLIAYLNSL